MAIKSFIIANFGERTGWDMEITDPRMGNLIRSARGIPVLGSSGTNTTDSHFISIKPVISRENFVAFNKNTEGTNIITFATPKIFFYPVFVVSNKGVIKRIRPEGVNTIHNFNTSYSGSVLVTDYNDESRIYFKISDSSYIYWKYVYNTESDPLNLASATVDGGVLPSNVFMFWKEYLYVASSSRNKIQVFTPDVSSSVGILNLPAKYSVFSLININDTYLGIVAGYSGFYGYYPKLLFLWDGNWQNIYFHRISFSKPIRGSATFNGITYLFVGESNDDLDVYTISSAGIRFVKRLNFTDVRTSTADFLSPPYAPNTHPLSSITAGSNFIVIPNTYYGEISQNKKSGAILWFPMEDVITEVNSKMLIANPSNEHIFHFAIAVKDLVYLFYDDPSTNTIKYTYFYVNTKKMGESEAYNSIGDFRVETNWFNLNNSQYVKIRSIEVYADNVNSSKPMPITIYYKDEKKTGSTYFSTVLPNVVQNGYQRIENIGILATKFKLVFNDSGSFPANQEPYILRKVVVTYEDEI